MSQKSGIYVSGGQPPFKFYIIGLGLVALVVLAFLFRFELGIFLLMLVGLTGIYGTMRIIFTGILGWQSLRRARLENDLLAAEVVTKHNQAGIITHGNYFLVSGPNGWQGVRVRDIEAPPQIVDGQAVEIEAAKADTIQVLKESDCVFVQGGRGAGKTNLMLWWMASKKGEKIVCDPKGIMVNPWPGCHVVSDDATIEYIVRRVAAEARRRKTKELFNEPPIYLLVDEMHYLAEDNDERPGLDIVRHVFAVVTIGRQYNVHASFTTSDGGVKALGIEGRGGLRDGLTWIELAQHPVTRVRECWIRHSRYGRIEASLPPVYTGIGSSKPLRLPAGVMMPQPAEPDEFEKDYNDGMSRNKLMEKYYPGMRRAAALAAVRERILRLEPGREPLRNQGGNHFGTRARTTSEPGGNHKTPVG